MADLHSDQTKLALIKSTALAFWRWLVGLLPVLGVNAKSFLEWLSAGERFKLSSELWAEIRDVAQAFPLFLLKLLLALGLGLNLARMLAENRSGIPIPQNESIYWLAALWLICTTIQAVVKSVTVSIVSKA